MNFIDRLRGFTVFTGGGFVDIAMKMLGIEVVGGIEIDPDIHSVAVKNGLVVTNKDVLQCFPKDFPRPNILHASPPCPNFSKAKKGFGEKEIDILLAKKIVEFIEEWAPEIFTLENVWYYRHSHSWKIIHEALCRLGYWVDMEHIDFSRLGVPQSRKRMIVRATRSIQPRPYPELPIHGWYPAVEDLIPSFNEDGFAEWQIPHLPETDKPFLLNGGTNNRGKSVTVRHGNEPCFTLGATSYKRPMRFQVNGKVYRLSNRGMARLQTIPDDYELPANNKLASTVIGNGIPPKGYETILRKLL